MKKSHILSLALSIVTCVGLLAGCTSNTSSASSSQEASSADTIKVGILAPLTGDAAQYGIAASNAAKLYFDQLNEAGGINKSEAKRS